MTLESPVSYRCQDGDMLDDICWRWYGDENAITAVLAANPGLADIDQPYSAGQFVYLPPAPAPEPRQTANLWD